jgi:hypothetical protein
MLKTHKLHVQNFQKLKENTIDMLHDDDELYERMVSCVNVAPDHLFGDGIEGHLEEDVHSLCEQRHSVAAMKGYD